MANLHIRHQSWVGRHGSRMFAEDRFCGATSTLRTPYQHFGGLIYGKGWDLYEPAAREGRPDLMSR